MPRVHLILECDDLVSSGQGSQQSVSGWEFTDTTEGEMDKARYLLLENGTVFEGKAFGAEGDVTGEVVFTTAMTGYLETLTDPSYYGQIVVQTFPLIGNYGVIPQDFESRKSFVKGYIVRDWCQEPSNFRNQGDLDTFCGNRTFQVYTVSIRELLRRSCVKTV